MARRRNESCPRYLGEAAGDRVIEHFQCVIITSPDQGAAVVKIGKGVPVEVLELNDTACIWGRRLTYGRTPRLRRGEGSDQEERLLLLLLAFELGADDYIMRPYAIRELLAIIHNVLRRCGVSAHGKLLRIRNLTIDPDKMEVRHKNHPLSLTQKEYGILLFLAENVGKVVTREDIMEEVWGYEINAFSGGMRTVDTHVRHIRVKLGEDGEMIETVHGVGFKMRAEDRTANTSPAD